MGSFISLLSLVGCDLKIPERPKYGDQVLAGDCLPSGAVGETEVVTFMANVWFSGDPLPYSFCGGALKRGDGYDACVQKADGQNVLCRESSISIVGR